MTTTYWRISPEVAGALAEGTEMDTSTHPPRVTRLHHRFDGWLGDDLLECFPCFLVTSRLASALERSRLIGFELGDAAISKSPEFEEMYPGRKLPDFRWLKVTVAQPADADFRLDHDYRLEVSDVALALLREVQIAHADIRHA